MIYSGTGATLDLAGGSIALGKDNLTADGPGTNFGGAIVYTFTISDTNGNAGTGSFTLVPSGLADDSMLATSGTLDITASNVSGATGNYVMHAVSGIGTDPYWGTNVDDLVYPANDAGSGYYNLLGEGWNGVIASPSFLDNCGTVSAPASSVAGSRRRSSSTATAAAPTTSSRKRRAAVRA